MPTAILTRKGQITIPSPVRDRLGLQAGDEIDFVFASDGCVLLQPKRIPFERLRGIARVSKRKSISIRRMDKAIERAVRARWKRATA